LSALWLSPRYARPRFEATIALAPNMYVVESAATNIIEGMEARLRCRAVGLLGRIVMIDCVLDCGFLARAVNHIVAAVDPNKL
jgi:hypothetical protein